jgi:hypothetical protein
LLVSIFITFSLLFSLNKLISYVQRILGIIYPNHINLPTYVDMLRHFSNL